MPSVESISSVYKYNIYLPLLAGIYTLIAAPIHPSSPRVANKKEVPKASVHPVLGEST